MDNSLIKHFAGVLRTIDVWRTATMQTVDFVGMRAGDAAHTRAWARSDPLPNDPRRPNWHTSRRPPSFRTEHEALVRIAESEFPLLNTQPMHALATTMTANGWEVSTTGQLPSLATLKKRVSEADLIVDELERLVRMELSRLVVRSASDGGEKMQQEEFQNARWFSRYTNVPSERLRKAKQDGRISVHSDGALPRYSVADATRLWPEDMPPLYESPESGEKRRGQKRVR